MPCRRCPLAYHRRCLPDNLPLERSREAGKRPRVWLADSELQTDDDGNPIKGSAYQSLTHPPCCWLDVPAAAGGWLAVLAVCAV